MRKLRRILSVMLLLCLFGGFAVAETAEDPESVTYLDYGARWVDIGALIRELEKYPNLEKVDMFGTPVGIDNINKLAKRFPDITFGWTIRFGEHAIRSDTTAYSTQHNSTSKAHTTRQVALFRYCTQLKALDIGYNSCNDLSFASGLTDLRVLIVSNNRVTDLSPLAGLTKLEYLVLSGNNIHDITPLTGLTHLMDLNLSYNNIEDLTPLTQMTWLKRLWLYRATNRSSNKPLSEETMQMLRDALPDTEIDFTSKPDSGAWRSHPHYDVIHSMFRNKNGYVPFEDSYPDE